MSVNGKMRQRYTESVCDVVAARHGAGGYMQVGHEDWKCGQKRKGKKMEQQRAARRNVCGSKHGDRSNINTGRGKINRDDGVDAATILAEAIKITSGVGPKSPGCSPFIISVTHLCELRSSWLQGVTLPSSRRS